MKTHHDGRIFRGKNVKRFKRFVQWYEQVRYHSAVINAENLLELLWQASPRLSLALQAISEGPSLI